MGTNYYAIMEQCPHCKRGERIHIGKHSGGWSFSFHGTDKIRSWSDWKLALAAPNVAIENDYGDALTLEDMLLVVDASRGKRDHIEWCTGPDAPELIRDHTSRAVARGEEWHDPEGFSFSSGEFS